MEIEADIINLSNIQLNRNKFYLTTAFLFDSYNLTLQNSNFIETLIINYDDTYYYYYNLI